MKILIILLTVLFYVVWIPATYAINWLWVQESQWWTLASIQVLLVLGIASFYTLAYEWLSILKRK